MIRKATLNDLEKIVTFNKNLAEETEDLQLDLDRLREGVKNLIEDPSKGTYYVYQVNGQVVGQIMYTKEWSDWRNGFFWWIQSVYVDQDYRNQGVFRALYHHLKQLVNDDDLVCGLRLYVEHENETAKKTYKQLGMTETYYRLYEWEQ